jgi:hypothetical protein
MDQSDKGTVSAKHWAGVTVKWDNGSEQTIMGQLQRTAACTLNRDSELHRPIALSACEAAGIKARFTGFNAGKFHRLAAFGAEQNAGSATQNNGSDSSDDMCLPPIYSRFWA